MKLNELIRRKTDGEKENTPKEPLTHEQQQRRKKMLIYPLMGLMFLGSMWLIFAPSAEEKEQEQTGTGFNTDMPLPTDAVIIGDKSKAYEQASLEAKRKERDRAVQDLASLFEGGEAEKENTEDEEYDLLNPGAVPPLRVIRVAVVVIGRLRYRHPPTLIGTSTPHWVTSTRHPKKIPKGGASEACGRAGGDDGAATGTALVYGRADCPA